MSVETQEAVSHDETIRKDITGEAIVIDNETDIIDNKGAEENECK